MTLVVKTDQTREAKVHLHHFLIREWNHHPQQAGVSRPVLRSLTLLLEEVTGVLEKIPDVS